MKHITVFGATGFIGRHLVRRLAKTGAIISVPTREPEKALLLKPMGDVGQIVPIRCNVRSDAAIAAAIGSSDAVINLIGILYEKGANSFQSIHVETAARIARISREQGAKRLAHMSALGASVSSPSSYARSKGGGEEAVRTFFPDANIFRPSIVFGPEDNFFNRFAAMARISPWLPLIGGGMTRFQPVYVGDVAEAMVRALGQPHTVGKTYELGGPDILTFRAMMDVMLRVIKRKRGYINIPVSVANLQAVLLEFLPSPPLTRDQVKLVKTDNFLHANARGFNELGITPTNLEIILPTYLGRFMPADISTAAPAKA
jgi:NADH dehydrogenase